MAICHWQVHHKFCPALELLRSGCESVSWTVLGWTPPHASDPYKAYVTPRSSILNMKWYSVYGCFQSQCRAFPLVIKKQNIHLNLYFVSLAWCNLAISFIFCVFITGWRVVNRGTGFFCSSNHVNLSTARNFFRAQLDAILIDIVMNAPVVFMALS